VKIAVVGRGNVGGGLADRWERAGHEVTRIGREGGDVSGADAEALDGLQGLEGKTAIDATNLVGAEPPAGFDSNAAYLKSRTNGPTAKAFNTNFARLYDRIDAARSRPGNLWSGDDEARDVVEQLTRDAGYDPIRAGGLEQARAQEDVLGFFFAINRAGLGPFVYRMASPEEL
jgi:8-hydroxy-5-deazaflavin:NADPH oxidoreductase